MNNILSEKEYQRYIIERLVGEHGYVERKNFCFDAKFAMDREMLFKFLDGTQPETMASRQPHRCVEARGGDRELQAGSLFQEAGVRVEPRACRAL